MAAHNAIVTQLTSQIADEQSIVDSAYADIKRKEEGVEYSRKIVAEGEQVIVNLRAAIEALMSGGGH